MFKKLMSQGLALSQIREAFGFAKAAEFVVRKLFLPKSLMQVRPAGIPHPITIRIASSDIYPTMQVFQGKEYNFDCQSAPRTIVDAGANIGVASVVLANRFPDARILAIEPEKGNFSQAVTNLAPYTNVEVIQAALWNDSNGISIVDPGLGEWGFQTKGATQETDSAHLVRSMTVMQILDEYGWDQIDILKMDIEGAEVEVLSDSADWIGKIGLMITELHDGERANSSRVFYNNTNGFDRDWRIGENVYTLNTARFSAGPGS